ncbi:carboxypeptidase-like regulatory domain-containing protein [Mucilaginibacter myungsuensis]|uniref:Carboxypeptidase-like regulatory domain-containing protein n=1 Tax=Mucilaginibacter myungsuensis TaxID=649104 RepID=A0A929KUT1_9SPHI|nr:carboxypeptidase-like regulatory domain-containing protein [Mucilaginibacter myungsuensis]MBE9660293.1 carboxypeptidase-like regulatory domain-containing protein [Mucilaginibacter myungsuensis]MDN3600335.1 carboxypeptidase-like regulatory domain-containing protein [Mucilaginibacter myungsuensis]
MQTDITNISIPQNCAESWNKMTQNNDGRFCTACASTVVDFTAMSPDEVIAYLTASPKTCGRFGATQLDRINEQLKEQPLFAPNFWKRVMVAATVFFTTQQVVKAQDNAAITIKTEQVPVEKSVISDPTAIKPEPVALRNVHGKVTDLVAKFTLPGATVYVNGKVVTATDAKGEFCLALPVSRIVIAVKSLGYAQTELKVKAGSEEETIEVALKEGPGAVMSRTVIRRASLPKRLYNRLIKLPIKKIFG